MKLQLDALTKEKILLQTHLSKAVGDHFTQTKENEETIIQLQKEKLELTQALLQSNKEVSPLKRKLIAIKSDNRNKTLALTDANEKFVSLQRERERE